MEKITKPTPSRLELALIANGLLCSHPTLPTSEELRAWTKQYADALFAADTEQPKSDNAFPYQGEIIATTGRMVNWLDQGRTIEPKTDWHTQIKHLHETVKSISAEQPQPVVVHPKPLVVHPNVTVAIEWLEKAATKCEDKTNPYYEVIEALQNLRLIPQPQPVAEGTETGIRKGYEVMMKALKWIAGNSEFVDAERAAVLLPQVIHTANDAIQKARMVAFAQPVAETPNRAIADAFTEALQALQIIQRWVMNDRADMAVGKTKELVGQVLSKIEPQVAAYEQHAPQQPAGDDLKPFAWHLTTALGHIKEAKDLIDDDQLLTASVAMDEAKEEIEAFMQRLANLKS